MFQAFRRFQRAVIQRYFFLALVASLAICFSAAPVRAQTSFDDSIKQIDTLVATLGAMIVTFSGLVISPLGIRSAARAYDHIVLRNL
ncbi:MULTISPECIES: hypothetical protein [unclassified Coleofasciculus]|uniref:hypothetical protein n=1 Tax=unclassified Coleofasciculus TaxID=2692782 RepID=UPI0018815C84|nr:MULTISPECIES: hypothetical protein [unclassified Coleofasciculus]MBE9124896.1 hypothetical protein [Coleofasciculus sp. LEGE 07081]MBE9147859.1 hypothetical protein [Coleofasciculus sp. LEGE 07092]